MPVSTSRSHHDNALIRAHIHIWWCQLLCRINEQLSEDNIEEQPSVESKDIPVYETPRTHETIESEGAMLMAEAQKMIYGLRLIIEAYILFDDDCDGFIQYEEVIKIIREHSPNAARPHESSQSATGLLSEERWQELDWYADELHVSPLLFHSS